MLEMYVFQVVFTVPYQTIKTFQQFCGNFLFMIKFTDYGRPMKPFFFEIQNFWAWADKL